MNQTPFDIGHEGTVLRLIMMPQPLPLLLETIGELGRMIERKEKYLTLAGRTMTVCLRTAILLLLASYFVPRNELWIMFMKTFVIVFSLIFIGLTGVINVLTTKCESYRRDLSLLLLKIGMEEDRATRVRNKIAESARSLECYRAQEDIARLGAEMNDLLAASRTSRLPPVLKEGRCTTSNWSSEAATARGMNESPLEINGPVEDLKTAVDGKGQAFTEDDEFFKDGDASVVDCPELGRDVKPPARPVGVETPKNLTSGCADEIDLWNSQKSSVRENTGRFGSVAGKGQSPLTNVSRLSEEISKEAVENLSESSHYDAEADERTTEMTKFRSSRCSCISNSPTCAGFHESVQDTGFFTPIRTTGPYTPGYQGSRVILLQTTPSGLCEQVTPKRVVGRLTHSRVGEGLNPRPSKAEASETQQQKQTERLKCIVRLSPLPPGSPHHIFDSLNGRRDKKELVRNSKL